MRLTTLDLGTKKAFEIHRCKWHDCTACEFSERAHQKVYARGTIPCDVLFIGEAPGEAEECLGEPFVGDSGKELNLWLVLSKIDSLKLTWAMTNALICRPTNKHDRKNRTPTPDEVLNCAPRLMEFLEIAKPKAIVLVGSVARSSPEIKPWAMEAGILTTHIVHPSFILRKTISACINHRNGIVRRLNEFFKSVQEKVYA